MQEVVSIQFPSSFLPPSLPSHTPPSLSPSLLSASCVSGPAAHQCGTPHSPDSRLRLRERIPPAPSSQLQAHDPRVPEGYSEERNTVIASLLATQDQIFLCITHAQTPSSHEERGLVTIERFLGCAESAKCH